MEASADNGLPSAAMAPENGTSAGTTVGAVAASGVPVLGLGVWAKERGTAAKHSVAEMASAKVYLAVFMAVSRWLVARLGSPEHKTSALRVSEHSGASFGRNNG